MERTAFHYDLPSELIAQSPLPERTASRMLQLDPVSGEMADRRFTDILDWLQSGDLVVLNNTRVLPARLFGNKASGGKVELLLERLLDSENGRFQLRSSRSPAPGTSIRLPGGASATVIGRSGSLFDLQFDTELESYLHSHGAIPLPPYIDRKPGVEDQERYQTVFADVAGAVAAPTAGLHFDSAALDALAANGVEVAYLTLHVGAGTFSPVRAERIEDHQLHAERVAVSAELCDRIIATQERGGRVLAVGTTSVRALESAAVNGSLQAFSGETSLYIYPGFEFRVVDAMLTNFHLPESSLLMLVSAFAGYEFMMSAYHHAVAERYRFFSYGDAMLITAREQA